ncbi:hypothetical protein D3C85_1795070 [compost metagenome]
MRVLRCFGKTQHAGRAGIAGFQQTDPLFTATPEEMLSQDLFGLWPGATVHLCAKADGIYVHQAQ